MYNCHFCKHKSVDTIDGGFLCKIHGPISRICICKGFEKDELKIKVIKCKNCAFFKAGKSTINTNDSGGKGVCLGTCLKYLLREFDGNSRQTCSQFVQNSQNIIT